MPSPVHGTWSLPVSLAYKYVKPGNLSDGRTPIIYMHAVSCCKENWMDLPEIVSSCTKRQAFALDARNHGDSERSDVWNYDVNVDDLFHFMDVHGIPTAILVGFAMGAITAYKAALREPSRVEKVFAVDMSVKASPVELTHSYLSVFSGVINDMLPTFNAYEAKIFLMKELFRRLPYEIKYLGRQRYAEQMFHIIRTPSGHYASKTCFEKMVASLERTGFIQSEYEGVYEGPVCLVYGMLSHTEVRQHEHLMKKHFPNLQIVGIENATHTVQRDCPVEFRNALLDFLREGDDLELGDIAQNDYVDMQTGKTNAAEDCYTSVNMTGCVDQLQNIVISDKDYI